jgi:hypothetical protein
MNFSTYSWSDEGCQASVPLETSSGLTLTWFGSNHNKAEYIYDTIPAINLHGADMKKVGWNPLQKDILTQKCRITPGATRK